MPEDKKDETAAVPAEKDKGAEIVTETEVINKMKDLDDKAKIAKETQDKAAEDLNKKTEVETILNPKEGLNLKDAAGLSGVLEKFMQTTMEQNTKSAEMTLNVIKSMQEQSTAQVELMKAMQTSVEDLAKKVNTLEETPGDPKTTLTSADLLEKTAKDPAAGKDLAKANREGILDGLEELLHETKDDYERADLTKAIAMFESTGSISNKMLAKAAKKVGLLKAA